MSNQDSFCEIEFKYDCSNIKLSSFLSLMEEFNYIKNLEISSWDSYFVSKNNPEEFIRFRNSTTPELTVKRKINQGNNWKRIEIDLPLDASRLTEDTVKAWTNLQGYELKTKLFKTCFIFWTDTINFVYYIVFNENMNELGRYVEIEANKDNGLTEEQSMQEIKKYEQALSKLGISPQNRLKRSLFELFVKE